MAMNNVISNLRSCVEDIDNAPNLSLYGDVEIDDISNMSIYLDFITIKREKKYLLAVNEFAKKYESRDLSKIKFEISDMVIISDILREIIIIENFRKHNLENTDNDIFEDINKSLISFNNEAVRCFAFLLASFKQNRFSFKSDDTETKYSGEKTGEKIGEKTDKKTDKKTNEKTSTIKTPCDAGKECSNYLKQHCERVSHPPRPCIDGAMCRDYSEQHCITMTHPLRLCKDFSEQHCTSMIHLQRTCIYGKDCELTYALHFKMCRH
jgi:hypothetical protein